MSNSQKLPTEFVLKTLVERGEFSLPPLEFVSFESESRVVAGARLQGGLHGVLTLGWGERRYDFGVEFRRLSTPKSIEAAIGQARSRTDRTGLLPLVIAPYLNGERLATLEAGRVSGVDLCGNGVVVVPGEFLVYRTGNPNRFPVEGAIKNVYRRGSSVVARAFLLSPYFASARELAAEVRRRGDEVAKATVSKVCTGLDEDLVIERRRVDPKAKEKPLRLLQPGKLLDLLAENYARPTVNRTILGKCTLPYGEMVRTLEAWAKRTGNRVVETGESSALAYAVMVRELEAWAERTGDRVVETGESTTPASAVVVREPMRSFYCTDLEALRKELGERIRETDRFANVEFLETGDTFVYFDRRPNLVASPIQTYLELVTGDKREKETAEQMRRAILDA
jgi:hypothetical protein